MKQIPLLLIGIVTVLLVSFFALQPMETETVVVTTFKECADQTGIVMESYPRQCQFGNETFVEYIGNELEKSGLIRLDSPRPNQTIESPLVISGEARGSWFFEANFPVVLTNWDGVIIAQGVATAQGDWMTADFVPFASTLVFTQDADTYSDAGTLILRKNNASDLPEYDDALEIPVVFKKISAPSNGGTVGILPFNSGVRGRVLRGPVCPVMQNPPDPNCADKPYESVVQVITAGTSKNSLFSSVETNMDGEYQAMLPPGNYSIQAVGGNPFPACSAVSVTIEPDVMTDLNLSCDTGIR
ncbi:MAG: Gmad2 immunoglobulin-like domain-containing protein [bacterium]|nr:Gmad2 immunoglobulin-like domain-containing protein [bacterium]